MERILIILIATLFITNSAKGQNLFFIDEQSYPSTESYTLQSNSIDVNDLNVLLAKDGEKALFAVNTRTMYDLFIDGKLIIYLDDGTVITLNDNGSKDYVDNTTKAVYYLTDEELSKMKNSNINTVRYSLEHKDGADLGGSFTASNKGESKIDFPAIITEFFSK